MLDRIGCRPQALCASQHRVETRRPQVLRRVRNQLDGLGPAHHHLDGLLRLAAVEEQRAGLQEQLVLRYGLLLTLVLEQVAQDRLADLRLPMPHITGIALS